ncbi:uncharacterized protein EV420DRAFT_1030188 [Desarmillaria tabescens]|uniref:Uncharacterized protein n=1 Tax=Armillaria tabescens TaxID=1929756 RepID=A0AA39JJL1_ARMTA|nr:uncharacterized protein EV420DRAFT_1030188 [Desarmillaria tabescens]KAK0443397.1 hypothetical protein EV420DRAFT_1030188 [Desarmillaria tabescens]
MDDARLGAALERFEGEGGPCREEWEIAFPAYGPRLSEQMPVVMDTVVFSCCQSFLTNTRPSRCRKPNLTPSFVPPDSHRDRGNIRQGEVLGMSGCSREGIIWVWYGLFLSTLRALPVGRLLCFLGAQKFPRTEFLFFDFPAAESLPFVP